jgi:hypothetical protein
MFHGERNPTILLYPEKNYKLRGLQPEKIIHRKTCISKEYILIHFDSTTTTTAYYNIIMGCCNSCYTKFLRFFSLRTQPILDWHAANIKLMLFIATCNLLELLLKVVRSPFVICNEQFYDYVRRFFYISHVLIAAVPLLIRRQ